MLKWKTSLDFCVKNTLSFKAVQLRRTTEGLTTDFRKGLRRKGLDGLSYPFIFKSGFRPPWKVIHRYSFPESYSILSTYVLSSYSGIFSLSVRVFCYKLLSLSLSLVQSSYSAYTVLAFHLRFPLITKHFKDTVAAFYISLLFSK